MNLRTGLMFLIMVVLSITLLAMAFQLPFGEPRHTDMDDYFLTRGQAETAANNICTAVVFDYRGFDTLGESTVLFCAVVGTGLMFRKLGRD